MSPVLPTPERTAQLRGVPPIRPVATVPFAADRASVTRVDVTAEAPASAQASVPAESTVAAEARERHPAGTHRAADGRGQRPQRARLHLAFDAARDEGGSLVAEYGLLLVLGATITMLATKWATGGAIWSLFGAVLSRARALVGA